MKPILFIDFDGVLCFDRFWRGLPEEHFKRLQEVLFEGNKAMLERWMRGGHTAEEVNQYVAENLGIPYEEVWRIFVEDAKTMYISKEVLDAIAGIRGLYQTVLITVNADSLDRFTVPALSLDTYFDLIVNSYTDGRFKYEDNGGLFVDAAKKLGAPIENAVLLDDSDNNCAVFRQLGGTACKVDKEHTALSYLEQLRKKPLYE